MEYDRLTQALEQFVNTEDWQEARRTVEENQNLLSDEAQQVLSENIADYRTVARDDVAEYLEAHRAILQRSREVGTEQAFREAEERARQTLQARERQLDALRPPSPDPLQAAVWRLLDADSPEEVDRVLAESPPLSREERALTYLDELMGRAKDAGYDQALRYMREYHELLRTLYEMPPLMRALQEFISVPTWTESRDAIKANPVLLSDEAIQTMDSLIAEARRQGDEPTGRALEAYRRVLERSRQVGPERAVEEIMEAQAAEPS